MRANANVVVEPIISSILSTSKWTSVRSQSWRNDAEIASRRQRQRRRRCRRRCRRRRRRRFNCRFDRNWHLPPISDQKPNRKSEPNGKQICCNLKKDTWKVTSDFWQLETQTLINWVDEKQSIKYFKKYFIWKLTRPILFLNRIHSFSPACNLPQSTNTHVNIDSTCHIYQ